jgi:penicillin-binding protein 1A
VFNSFLRTTAAAIANLALLAALAGAGAYVVLERRLPAVTQLADAPLAQPLQVYSHDGMRIAEFGDQRRIPLNGDALPTTLVHAILAAEDANFYAHPGFDTGGLLRAAWHLLRSGELRQGGSTITMQVARNFFLSQDKTFLRKALEILLAIRIEQNLNKDQILALYINKIFLGNRAYGFGAAARTYYGRPIETLTVAELAMLAGLPKAPSRDNPLVNPQRALERRNYVLGRMYALGYLDNAEYQQALAQPDTAGHFGFEAQVEAPYAAEMARTWMVERFGTDAYEHGYRVITTIDSQQQSAANAALRAGLLAYSRRHGFRAVVNQIAPDTLRRPAQLLAALRAVPAVAGLQPAVRLATGDFVVGPEGTRLVASEVALDPLARTWRPAAGDVVYLAHDAKGWSLAQVPEVQGAFVAMQPETGAITALVGGFDFQRSSFNRAVQALRQPGSTFKPFIYAAALATGFTAASVINDAPVAFPADTPDGYWRPENYTGRFYGPTRLREALANSRNLVSVRLLHAVGVDFTRSYCLRFGFAAERLPNNLSLALGTASTTPLELTAAYAVIANGGYRVTPGFIDSVLDKDGNVVWRAPRTVLCDDACDTLTDDGQSIAPAPRVLPATDAFILNSMLQDVIDHGTATRARSLNRPDLAGKTGTTNDERDAWFVGFNRQLLATAWVGFDQPRSLGKGETGAHAALPIWMDFMTRVLPTLPVTPRPIPEGLVSLRVDKQTGLRVDATAPDSYFEWFSADRLPPTAAAQTTPTAASTENTESHLF